MGSNIESFDQDTWLRAVSSDKPIPSGPSSLAYVDHGYKRTFAFDVGHNLKDGTAILPEELLLFLNKKKYDGLVLVRARWQQSTVEGDLMKTGGTYFALGPGSPPASWTFLLMTAGHCEVSPQRYWTCSHEAWVDPDVFNKQPTNNLKWTLTKPAVVTANSPLDMKEYAPSDGTTEVMLQAYPEFSIVSVALSKRPSYFIPCASAGVKSKVCVLGYASFPEKKWGQLMLRTEEDALPNPSPDFELDENVAASRIVDLVGSALHPDQLVASPGEIVGMSQRIVEHTCTTFPGMSGSPGVDLENPTKLYFVHIAGDRACGSRKNYGLSVNHPAFVQAYISRVLPNLAEYGKMKTENRAMLQKYVEHNKAILDSAGWQLALSFLSRIQTDDSIDAEI